MLYLNRKMSRAAVAMSVGGLFLLAPIEEAQAKLRGVDCRIDSAVTWKPKVVEGTTIYLPVYGRAVIFTNRFPKKDETKDGTKDGTGEPIVHNHYIHFILNTSPTKHRKTRVREDIPYKMESEKYPLDPGDGLPTGCGASYDFPT